MLNPDEGQNLNIREEADGEIYVESLTEVPIKSLDQAKAAHETLTKMGQRAQPLIDKHKQLYAGPAAELQAKAAALKSSLAAGIPLLHAETDRIQQIQGARDVLEAPLTKIIALLNPQV